jgi:mRNA interferase MazF
LKRGEIWTISGGADFTGKPRRAVIVQSDDFDSTRSIAVCPLTSVPVSTVYARFVILASDATGLRVDSQVMVDKISTIPKSKVGRRLGRLRSDDITRLNQRLALFLGLAD